MLGERRGRPDEKNTENFPYIKGRPGEKNVDDRPHYNDKTRDDPLSFVVSMNIKRRHLNESQRAVIAAKIANMKKHDNQYTVDTSIDVTISQSEAAKIMNISVPTIQRVKQVEREAPELLPEIEKGNIREELTTLLWQYTLISLRRTLFKSFRYKYTTMPRKRALWQSSCELWGVLCVFWGFYGHF